MESKSNTSIKTKALNNPEPITDRRYKIFETLSSSDIYTGPEVEYPKLETGLGNLILNKLNHNPDRIYQIDPDQNVMQTCGEIHSQSICVAMKFIKLSLLPGDKITLCTENHLTTILPILAGLYTGIVVNIVTQTLNDNELLRMIDLCKPKMIICDTCLIDRFTKIVTDRLKTQIYSADRTFNENFVQEEDTKRIVNYKAVECDDNDLALILTTRNAENGFVKGIPFSHINLFKAVVNASNIFTAEDIILSFYNIYYHHSIWVMLSCILFGGIRISTNWTNAQHCLNIFKSHNITFFITNTLQLMEVVNARQFVKANATGRFEYLNSIMLRGSSNSKGQMEYFRFRFKHAHIVNSLGCAEMGSLVAYFDLRTQHHLNITKSNSVGKLCPGVSAIILDVNFPNCLGPDQPGELFLKSTAIAPGYLIQSSGHLEVFSPQGWFPTGDLAFFDVDDCLYIIGRVRNKLKFLSETVSPAEVEFIINQHPGVKESCVVGIPDPTKGDLPVAFVVKKDNSLVTAHDILMHVQGKAQDHQLLRGGVKFVTRLPHNKLGGFDRNLLQKMAMAHVVKTICNCPEKNVIKYFSEP